MIKIKIMNKSTIFTLLISALISVSGSSQNLTRPNIVGPGGVRVNSYTGNMFLQRSDLYLAGRIPIDISFSYNSSDRKINRGYGRGWTFNYGMKLIELHDSVMVVRNDGRNDIFTPGSPTLLTAPKGIFDSLKKIGVGVYQLRSKDGTKYFFENPTHKRLTKIEDRNNNALVFSYTDSLISTITDGAGRAIQLTYSGGNLATIVEANGSPTRTISFDYDNGGNLKKVTDPMSFTTEYSYAVNGPMNTVKDKNGNVVDVVYNESFAVKEIISCLTKQTITYNATSLTTHVTELIGTTNQVTSYKFNNDGNLIQKTGNCCGYNVKYEYDQDKNVSKLTDADGNVYTYTYDNRGNMLSETDPLNHTSLYSYEIAYNQLTDVTDKNGNRTSYSYDVNGNLLTTDKPLTLTTSYIHATNGDLTKFTDGRGNSTSFTYDTYGNIVTIHRPLNCTTTFTYDSKSRKITETDPLTYTTNFSYDKLNRLLSITNAMNSQSVFTYDPNGNLLTSKDANNHITTNSYDALDRVIKVTNPLGKSKKMIYDAKGNILNMADENENSTINEYDNLNRIISKSNAANETFFYSYDNNGNLVSVSYPNGNTVTLIYDRVNRLIQVSDAVGAISEYIYDNNDNKISEKDGSLNITTFTYDALNRLTTVTDPLGHSSHLNYDKTNNIVSLKNKNDKTTIYMYDALNRQTSVKDPLNYVTTFSYDAMGNLINVSDANNNNTSYAYDSLNRKILQTFADGSTRKYTYDKVGNVLTKQDGNSIITSYTYNSADRLIARAYPSNLDLYSYDDAGRMITANNNNASISFEYDVNNRLTKESLNGKQTEYIYDIAGRKRSLKYPGGRLIVERYDERDRLIEVKDGSENIATFNYDMSNRNTNLVYSNGTSTTFLFDPLNRITSISSNPNEFQVLTYSYDKEGNKLFEKKLHGNHHSEQYTYDDDNRLVGFKRGALVGEIITTPVGQIQYNYDGAGNRTSMNVNGNVTLYTANVTNSYVNIVGTSTISPSYDNNGNLIYDGLYHYSYDSQNRLSSVNNNSIATYKYDALGRRIEKTLGSSFIKYYYAGDRVIQKDSLNNIKATYVYGTWVDEILSMNIDSSQYFFHPNALGSVSTITNKFGNVVERYEYDPYGKVDLFDASDNQISSPVSKNEFSFCGRQVDFETGNINFRNRDYKAGFGRFNQRDPLGFLDDFSMYGYARCNPVNFTDPYGLKTVICKKPLHSLGGSGTKTGPDKWWNPLYHEYICVFKNNEWICGGQDRAGNPVWSPGKPSEGDYYSPTNCEDSKDSNDCVDNCLIPKLTSKNRPRYGIGPQGTDCQDWVDDQINDCIKKCQKK
jgi:RHS repeat-associated protein